MARHQPRSSNLHLDDIDLPRKRLHKIAAQRDDILREAWQLYVDTHFTKEQYLFLDESGRSGHTMARNYGRAPRGQRPEERTMYDRGENWSILPALSLDGYVALRVIPGAVDGAEYYDFVVNEVLNHTTPFPGPRSVIVMDNASIHKSQALELAIEAAGT